MNGELYQEHIRYSDAFRAFAMADGWIMVEQWTNKVTNFSVNSEGIIVEILCGAHTMALTLDDVLEWTTNAEGILMRTHLKTYFKEIV
jgi:hypothetical protein